MRTPLLRLFSSQQEHPCHVITTADALGDLADNHPLLAELEDLSLLSWS